MSQNATHIEEIAICAAQMNSPNHDAGAIDHATFSNARFFLINASRDAINPS